MSLSDNDNSQFEPLSVGSLESLDDEVSKKTDESKPDFNRFKALFEKTEFEEKESFGFEAIFEEKKEQEEIVFKPLVEKKEDPLNKEVIDNAKQDSEQQILGNEDPEEPEETPEEKGYREGLDQGIEQGKKDGYEEGFKEGEEKGLEKGEQEGKEKGQKQGFEQGFDQGLSEGEEKGTKQTQEKAVEILSFLEESLKSADQTLDLLVEKYEERIISLIQQIVTKVIMARIEIDDEIVKNMILEALKELIEPEEIILSVSSDDYEYIELVKEEFFEQIDSLNSISVRSDPSIKKGGCKIETNTASVAVDADSKLEAIFDAIKAAGA
ncbi:MAG: flagellar biosynthesis/type III secretory pathway protein [Desulfobacteraceae bacterium]|nr:flagellar biosynthesis/type III secretory pathway protein [Desulfobacteraceae bacterium]